MIKIGIITYFYNSTNYGGVLQSYALCNAINKLGNNKIKAEQICYDYDSFTNNKIKLKQRIKNFIKRILSLFVKKYRFKPQKGKIRAFKDFVNQYIPHSENVYDINNIYQVNGIYDLFITGSDQVWNPISLDDNFFLNFVSEKKKISYAASIGADEIDQKKIDILVDKLRDFDIISVREESAKKILEKNGVHNVTVQIDPVFLLSKEEWSAVAESKIQLKDRFIFVYLLSGDVNLRKRIEMFATNKGLVIYDFSPIQLFTKNYSSYCNKGPLEFVKYISEASYCCTDSFHCTAFCLIFKKRFVTFCRKNIINQTSNNRIVDLLNKFNLQEHALSEITEDLDIIENEYQCEEEIKKYKELGLNFIKEKIIL